MMFWATIALALVIVFCLLEFVECYYEGLQKYFSDAWNVMDWLNFYFFFITYSYLRAARKAIDVEQRDCSSYLCADVGYFDDWLAMGLFRNAKLYLSLCLCIQFFKILKFADALVPKTGLATKVLRNCVIDLVLFLFTFIISMLAFSMMLSVQLGPVMEGYRDQIPAFISLFRALFGDFDIDEIMDNSSGYFNTLLFLTYLFVAVFIMLSMFLAILAEAQVAVRLAEETQKAKPDFHEYGVLWHCYDKVKRVYSYACGPPPAARAAVVNDADKRDEYAKATSSSISMTAASVEGGEWDTAVPTGSAVVAPPSAVPTVMPTAVPAVDNAQLLSAIVALQSEVAQLRERLGTASAMPGTMPRSFSLGTLPSGAVKDFHL